MPSDRSRRTQQERLLRQLERESARAQARQDREELKAAKERYLAARLEEAAEFTEQAAQKRKALDSLLSRSLKEPVSRLDLNKLRRPVPKMRLHLGADAVPISRPEWVEPREPGFVGRLFGGSARHERARKDGAAQFERDLAYYEAAESARQRRVVNARRKHAEQQAAAERRVAEANASVDRLISGVESREAHAVSAYYEHVLRGVKDPSDFPTARRAAYVSESALLVVEWDLPKFSIVPESIAYRYVKLRDEIDAKPMASTERRATYQRLIAQMALRAVHIAFGADPNDLVETVVFNGIIDDIDHSTGQEVRRCLITLRATREQFQALVLERVKPVDCVRKHFAAEVSEHPEELKAVPPVLEFDMADPRVTDPVDVLSEIDSRPNLLDLSPTEFEHFIQNLFAKMGFQVQVFKAGGDGGIDCVVYDPRPMFGGKFCVQVKQYVGTVQPTAVRDLFGAVQHEGATKGILITTGGFGPSSYAWANGKPLQLITGTELLHLCHENNIPARILRRPKARHSRSTNK